MSGWHEIRVTGPGRDQFRLFCLRENGTRAELAIRGLARPVIAVITGDAQILLGELACDSDCA